METSQLASPIATRLDIAFEPFPGTFGYTPFPGKLKLLRGFSTSALLDDAYDKYCFYLLRKCGIDIPK